MLILTVVTGPDKGAVYRLDDEGSHRIGRRHGAIPLNDKGASSKHAEINRTIDGWTITDLDSSNGTYVNKDRIDLPTGLHDGDRIQVGRSMLVFNVVETAELDDDEMQEAGPTAAIHAALAAQYRNQELLGELKALLEGRPAEGAAGGAPDTANDEIAALVRQVVERLDRADATDDEPDTRLDEVLDQLRAIRQREVVVPPAPEPVDLQPVLDAIEAIQSRQAAGAEATAPPEPVDLQPVLDAIESLKQSQPSTDPTEPIDLTPVIEKIDALADRPEPETPTVDLAPVLAQIEQLKREEPAVDLGPILEKLDAIAAAEPPATPEPAEVDFTPITEKLDELRASQPAVDLQPVLDAIEALKQAEPTPAPEPIDLQPVLDAIEANRASDPSERFDRLTEQIDSLRDTIERSADAEPGEAIDVSELRDQLDAIRRSVEADPTGALTEKLDQIVEAVNRQPEQAGDAPALDPAELTQRLDDLRTKVNDLSTARLDEKIDQLLDIASAPTEQQAGPVDPAVIEKLEQVLAAIREAPASGPSEPTDLAPVTDRIAELRSAIDALAERAPASGDGSEPAVVQQVMDRIDRMEASLTERASESVDTGAAVELISERIEAIVDVLRTMPAGGSDNDEPAPAPAPAFDEETLAELNAKLEVIFEAIQQSRGERAAASDEIDSLIDMVRNEHSSTDTESALSKVLARLDRMAEPTPTFDAELLERLEKVAIKLDKLQISGIDIPDPTPLLADTIEPLIRQIHDKVTHGEAVDLRGTEQRIAELAESVRDAINHSDRPLLEQILVELRERTTGGEGGTDADKIELLLERTSRIDDLRELEPLVKQLKDAADLAGNDKIVALLRQLIEHVQTMPSKFDGKETMDNVFQSLRRLEQQQEQQAATLRRLVASVAESEERLSQAVSSAAPARQSMRFAPPAEKKAPLPAPTRSQGETDIDPELEKMLDGTDPTQGKRKMPIILTIALIIVIPLVGIYTAMNWDELTGGSSYKAPAPDSNRDAPDPDGGSGDNELTRK